jgi:UDP-3-O-[3-hydroxymyristoyl] N-acetylglucosamine deacetylase
MTDVVERIKITSRTQNTIKAPATFSGIGIHTGRIVSLRFLPAECGTGIVFKRIDLPSCPEIPATLEYVCDTSRSTTLGVADVRIHTVEHVLAAVRAYNIDNLIIEISSIEPPIGNGSSDVFVDMIVNAGVEPQEGKTPIVYLNQPVFWSEGDIHVVAIPYDGYRISYTLNYPDSKVLNCQYRSFEVTQDIFRDELASCRTFSEYKEVEMLMNRGLIKGGSLDNAVIIKDEAIFSKGGLFFPDEMVRHKILDMVGDLSLVGLDFKAHVIAVRSGHQSNVSFAKILYQTLTREVI